MKRFSTYIKCVCTFSTAATLDPSGNPNTVSGVNMEMQFRCSAQEVGPADDKVPVAEFIRLDEKIKGQICQEKG